MAGEHILVVDDEQEVRELIRDYLVKHGYAVSMAKDGEAMRAVLRERPAHLAILDLRMPGEDGLSLARHLRALGSIGIIMVTASTEVIDRVVGLEMGADDYVAKPFDPRELLARVRSVLRRVSSTAPARADLGTLGLEVRMGKCVLNIGHGKLYAATGEEVPITAMEFDLLKAFAEHPNRPLSRDQLLDIAHNREMDVFDRSVDIRIMRLRRKIEDDAERPQVIKTVRGKGYVFATRGPA